MKNRMTKNNVHTLAYLVILFLFILPISKIIAADSQANVNVPGPLIITISGSNPVNLVIGGTYTDAGAIVLDTSNGVVPVTTISNNVNTAVAGIYSVVYRAVDIAGSVATATRVVNVLSASSGGRRWAQSPDITSLGVGGDTESTFVNIPLGSSGQISILPIGFCFNKNLNSYESDSDVKYLQIFLNNYGFFATPDGSENDYYSAETANAVTLFQEQDVIIPFAPFDPIVATGNFDDATRKKANDILGCNTISETVVNTVPSETTTTSEVFVATTTKVFPAITPKVITNTSGQINVKVEGSTTTASITETNIKTQENTVSTTTPNVYNPNFIQRIIDIIVSISMSVIEGFKSLFGF